MTYPELIKQQNNLEILLKRAEVRKKEAEEQYLRISAILERATVILKEF